MTRLHLVHRSQGSLLVEAHKAIRHGCTSGRRDARTLSVRVDHVSLRSVVAHVHLLDGHTVLTEALFAQLLEVVHDSLHVRLVARHALLKYVEGARDDVELADDLFESLSELLATTGDTVSARLVVGWEVRHCSDGAGLTTHLRRAGVHFRSGWRSTLLSLGGGRTSRSLFGNVLTLRHSRDVLTGRTLRTEIFNKLLLILVKVALPDHDDRIGATGREEVTAGREANSIRRALVTVQGVQDVALTQIPDLERRVLTRRQQISTVRVELDTINIFTVGIVALNKPLAANIPDMNSCVLTTGGDARAIRMELHRVDARIVIAEGVDDLAGREVEQLHSPIV